MGKDFHLPDYTIKLPLKKGEVYKNYKELCKKLGEEERTGGARQNQHKHWSLYFDYQKEKYSYVIKAIFNKSYSRWDNITGKQGLKDKTFCPLTHRRYYDTSFPNKEWKYYYSLFKGKSPSGYGVHFAYLCLGYPAGIKLRKLERLNELVESLWLNEGLPKKVYLQYKKYYEYFINDIELGYNNSLDIATHKRSQTMQSYSEVSRKYIPRSRQSKARHHLQPNKNVQSGLYRFINEHEEVIYIGQSVNLKNRIISHLFSEQGKLTQQTLDELDRIEVLIFNPYLKTLTEMLEIYYINKYQPILNISRKYSPKEFVMIQELENLENEWLTFWKPPT